MPTWQPGEVPWGTSPQFCCGLEQHSTVVRRRVVRPEGRLSDRRVCDTGLRIPRAAGIGPSADVRDGSTVRVFL